MVNLWFTVTFCSAKSCSTFNVYKTHIGTPGETRQNILSKQINLFPRYWG